MEQFTVILFRPDLDGVAAAAIAARAAGPDVEALAVGSQHLVGFFTDEAQRRLPAHYRLVICGLELVRTDWDGRLVRPALLDALRDFTQPIRWFSGRAWAPEDIATLQHMFGEERIRVRPDASSEAALVRELLGEADDRYADWLVAMAEDRLPAGPQSAWGKAWRHTIPFVKDDPPALAQAVGLLAAQKPQEIPKALIERAERTEREVLGQAAAAAGDAVEIGERRLIALALPRRLHPFWKEAGAAALRERDAQFCLCALSGRDVLALARREGLRVDLEGWARYVTDLMPGASVVERQPEAEILNVPGLKGDQGLLDEVVRLLIEGAHLLRG